MSNLFFSTSLIVNSRRGIQARPLSSSSLIWCTATKIPFIYSFSGNCVVSVPISTASIPISTFMCPWSIYIFPRSVHVFPAAEKADRSWEYINRSQTHECGNWDFGQAIPFLGIFVSNFRYWFFAMWNLKKTLFSLYLSPNFHIHVSVRELYISMAELPFLLEEICGLILGIYKSLTDTWMYRNWGWGRVIPRKGIYKRNCLCSVRYLASMVVL
jgi:hypothetical protein